MKQEPQDSRHNMRMMYAQAMHDKKNEMIQTPTSSQTIAKPTVKRSVWVVYPDSVRMGLSGENKPAAWLSLNFADLQTAVYNYTYDVINTLEMNGVKPTWVQTGNEVNNGLLWPTGQITGAGAGGAANYAALINSGYNAVKAVDTAIKIVLHISNGYDDNLFRFNLDALKGGGGKWDITGMSSYPSTSGWAANNTSVLATMQDVISRYGKPVMVCETGIDVNSAAIGQQMLTDMMTKTASLGNNGLGLFYWEPEAYGGWQNYSLGAFDATGKPTIAMSAFSATFN